MARLGENPKKRDSKIHVPQRITITTIVYIPILEGFWLNSLDVLKACLRSMRAHTSVPFDLMVFDNGSCDEVIAYLEQAFSDDDVQYLLLSRNNVGKSGAWNQLLDAAPGEIIGYCDSDVLFFSDWLATSLKLLENFPRAGMVTAQPASAEKERFLQHNSSTLTSIEGDPTISLETGDLIPAAYREAHRMGLGDEPERYQARYHDQVDFRINSNNISAFITASHFQFLATRNAIKQVLPLSPKKALGDVYQLDQKLNNAGFWRLSTTDYLVHHMGNQLPTSANKFDGLNWLDIENLLRKLSVDPMPQHKAPQEMNQLLYYLITRSRIKQLLRRLNTFSFEVLRIANST